MTASDQHSELVAAARKYADRKDHTSPVAGSTILLALDSLEEQKEATDATLGKIALMQSGALAIIRDNGFVFEDIGKEPGNWQHLAFTLYNLICEIDVEARHALGIEIGDSIPTSGERVVAGMPSSTSATAGASQSPEDSSPADRPDS